MTADRFAVLSPRQMDELRLLAQGLRDQDIAAELGLSESVVHVHLRVIFKALGAKNRAQAAYLLGYRLGRRA